jgi:CheY-like chemotaxis protein
MARILIVDDEPVNRLLLSAVLSPGGHEVIEAGDADAALAHIRARIPDLTILDLHLPGESGVDVVRTLRADARTAHAPIALYTSSMMDDAMRDFMEMWNVRHVIPKPGEPHEIIAAVTSALSEKP